MVPTAGAHQVGQEVFRAILAEDVDWKPFPAFPPSVRLAVVVGQPSEARSDEYVTQITAMGPLGLEYLRATDDPRNR